MPTVVCRELRLYSSPSGGWDVHLDHAEDGGFELPPAYLHTNTRSCVGQYFAAFDPMFLGVPKTHVSWIPKFPTHESAHGPLRRALPLRITRTGIDCVLADVDANLARDSVHYLGFS